MNAMLSNAQILAAMSEEDRERWLSRIGYDARVNLRYDWNFWGRPNQLSPGPFADGTEWLTWLVLAGRGFGKTRMGSEWIRENVCGATPLAPGKYKRVALVAETAADARDVIVEGDSGILSVHRKDFRPTYEVSKRRLTWPNGAVATLYNGTEPDQLRGPQHDLAWVDELAKYRYAQETWDMLQFGLRLGDQPRQMVTTTPRPIPLIKELVNSHTTITTRGKTSDNFSNLAEVFLKNVVDKYAGTRLGRQELDGDILDDLPGALWNRLLLDANRIRVYPEMTRIVVAVDPSGSKGTQSAAARAKGNTREKADDIGIVVVGKGIDGNAYVLADGTCNLSPEGWGRRVIQYYHGAWSPVGEEHKANAVVGEINFGGDMVRAVIHAADPTVRFKSVRASRGKLARAEPVALLYEQGRVKHCGSFPQLEDQMCEFAADGYIGEGSPDRVDALVWAITDLMLNTSNAMMLLRGTQ